MDIKTLRPYTHADLPGFKPLICLESRGWEPVEFILGDEWKAKALNSDQVIDNFSLEDNEWVDYDEKSGQPMEVFGIETSIIKSS